MSYYAALAPFYDAFMEGFPYARYGELCRQVFSAAPKPVTSALDLACGTGTLSCMLAEMGYDVVACDASPEMLWEASKKKEGENPLFICQNMEELDLFGTVSAALCSLDGLNHLPPQKLGRVLARVRLFMEPGAPFLFDINTEEKLRSQDGQCFSDEAEGALCLWQSVFIEDHSEFYTDLFIQEGALWRRESAAHQEFIYPPDNLKHLLLEAGFSTAECLGELFEDCPGREFWLAGA